MRTYISNLHDRTAVPNADSREPLVRKALSRVSARSWPAAVQHAHEVDRLIKGLHVSGRLQDPWEEMNRLAMRIAFKPT